MSQRFLREPPKKSRRTPLNIRKDSIPCLWGGFNSISLLLSHGVHRLFKSPSRPKSVPTYVHEFLLVVLDQEIEIPGKRDLS